MLGVSLQYLHSKKIHILIIIFFLPVFPVLLKERYSYFQDAHNYRISIHIRQATEKDVVKGMGGSRRMGMEHFSDMMY